MDDAKTIIAEGMATLKKYTFPWNRKLTKVLHGAFDDLAESSSTIIIIIMSLLVHVSFGIALQKELDPESIVASSSDRNVRFLQLMAQQRKMRDVDVAVNCQRVVPLFVVVQNLVHSVGEALDIQATFLNIERVFGQVHLASRSHQLSWAEQNVAYAKNLLIEHNWVVSPF